MAGIATKGAGTPAVRKKQMIILGGFAGVVGVIAIAVSMMGTAPKRPAAAQAPSKETRKSFSVPGEQVNASDVWRTQEGAKVQQLQQELADLKTRMQAADRAETEQKKREAERGPATPPPGSPLAPSQTGQLPQGQIHPTPVGPFGPAGPAQSARPAGGPVGAGPHDLPAGTPGPQGAPQGERLKGIARIDFGNSESSGATAGPGKAAAIIAARDGGGGQEGDMFIPTGSFVRAILLSGLDAPTGGQVQQNPHPIVMQITDFATLPNRFRADVKLCHVTGNGYGDLSSERAYIRLDRISCVYQDGGAVDIPIKGYVSGDDGRAGVRGRLVSKQGAALQNALLSGITAGIGQAFSLKGQTTTQNPLGSSTSVNPGHEFRVGMGEGVGKALDKLSSYYLKLADQMFPVIEIDAGRMVDIVVTSKVALERK